MAKKTYAEYEVTALVVIKTAANQRMVDCLIRLQAGLPIERVSVGSGGVVTVAPVLGDGELVWKPTVEQLKAMN